MKKTLSVLLIFLMLFSFVACEETDNPSEDPNHAEKTIEEVLDELSKKELEQASGMDADLIAPARDAESNLCGYINTLGEWVCKPAWSSCVELKDGFGMFINEYGEYVFVNIKDGSESKKINTHAITSKSNYSEGIAAVSLLTRAAQTFAYVNEDYKVLITADDLPKISGRRYEKSNYFDVATPFKNSKAVVMRLLNADISKKDKAAPESAFVINREGELLATLPEGLDPDDYGFDNRMNVIVKNNDNLYGICNQYGALITECKYNFVRHIDGDLYLVCNENGFWGYINEHDERVITCQYNRALPFTEGIAAVCDNDEWKFIKEDGSLAFDTTFEDIKPLAEPDLFYTSVKGAFSSGVAAVKKYGYWMLINKSGEPVFALKADALGEDEPCPYKGIYNGIVIYTVPNNDSVLYGAITADGKQLLEPKYAELGVFSK